MESVQSVFEKAGMTYRQEGEYMIPNVELTDNRKDPTAPMGKYGHLRWKYLKENRPATFDHLALTDGLTTHIEETQEQATEMLTQLMEQYEEQSPPPDKATDMMGWVGHMNNLKRMAEEVVCAELIYI